MLWKAFQSFVYVSTGEFLLKGEANGGTVVFLRSVLTATLLFVVSIAVLSLLKTGFHSSVDWALLAFNARDKIEWAGAMFAGSYAALYSRFSSQWNYLAGVYNQLMAAQAQAPLNGDKERHRVYSTWKAGILEDAFTLHLATKQMFAPLVADLLEDRDVYDTFRRTAVATDKDVERLRRRLVEVTKRDIRIASKWRDPEGNVHQVEAAAPQPALPGVRSE
jgi:hypothetical protein